METKWSSLVSYGLTVEALTDFLPLDVTLDVKTVRHDTLKIAERCEAELGEEQWSFIEGCPRDWGALPIPDGPITVGIDGGYVRDWDAKKHNFEVIVGKSILAFTRDEDEETPSSKRFGFVQTVDTKPKRRLYEVLKSQGFQLNQQITFLSDGEDTVRDLQLYLSPEAEHILDLSLSRLNHRLPRGQTHPEIMQGTAEFHHQIADTRLPQAYPVFHDATALDTAVDVLDPQPTLVQRLVRQLLL
jgi:hypothetical protein